MKTKSTLLYTAVDVTTSFDSGVVSTGQSVDAGLSSKAGAHVAGEKCLFTLNVSAFAGTSMAVAIKAVIGGVDTVLGSFTSVTGAVNETITIDVCPADVKIVGTAVTVTDFDATVYSTRFV